MKIKINSSYKAIELESSRLVNIESMFLNTTNQNIIPPSTEARLNSKFFYHLYDCTIYGNRSCLVNEELIIDYPLEWDSNQKSEYISRVKKTHTSEFSFLEDFNSTELTATIRIGRPYTNIRHPCIYVGAVEAWNFGFFISVLAFKIHLSDKIDPNLPILIPITQEWQSRLLAYLFPKKNFIFYDPQHPITVKEIYFLGWPNFGFYMDKDYLHRISLLTKSYSNGINSEKIFLRRNKFNGVSSRVSFSKDDVNLLIKRGFTPLFPENHSYKELHSILRSCKHLILESGSALFNGIFLPSTAKVTLLESRFEFLNNHTRFISSITPRNKIIFCNNLTTNQALKDID